MKIASAKGAKLLAVLALYILSIGPSAHAQANEWERENIQLPVSLEGEHLEALMAVVNDINRARCEEVTSCNTRWLNEYIFEVSEVDGENNYRVYLRIKRIIGGDVAGGDAEYIVEKQTFRIVSVEGGM